MDDETRKALTEYGGECVHNLKGKNDRNGRFYYHCTKCKYKHYGCVDGLPRSRTFSPTGPDAWADYGWIVEAMDRKGDRGKYEQFALARYKELKMFMHMPFTVWLNRPARLELIGEWVKETKHE